MDVLNPEAAKAFLRRAFPNDADVELLDVEAIEAASVRIRLCFHERLLRPGNTVSGPAMMKLVDTGAYLSLLANCGVDAAGSATSHLGIHFLRRAGPNDLVAEVSPIRIGRRLAVISVTLYASGESEPCACATVTYALAREQDAST